MSRIAWWYEDQSGTWIFDPSASSSTDTAVQELARRTADDMDYLANSACQRVVICMAQYHSKLADLHSNPMIGTDTLIRQHATLKQETRESLQAIDDKIVETASRVRRAIDAVRKSLMFDPLAQAADVSVNLPPTDFEQAASELLAILGNGVQNLRLISVRFARESLEIGNNVDFVQLYTENQMGWCKQNGFMKQD